MDTIVLILILFALWGIGHSLKRIIFMIRHLKVEVTIPIYGDDGSGQPVELPPIGDNVVRLEGKRRAG